MFENSELNITYLLGAGASANALPTVKKTKKTKGIASEFEKIAKQLKETIFDDKYASYISELIGNLNWLSQKTLEFGTPDTFAKYLFIKKDPQLIIIKNTLSAFFLIEQIINKKFDNRSLVFLINMLEQHTIFPENIKILTWNYDFQIQLVAEKFREERFTYRSNSLTHSPPLVGYYPQLDFGLDVDISEISMVHLNGIAGTYFSNNMNMFKSFFERIEERDINYLLQLLTDENYQKNALMYFAWEKNGVSNRSIDIAKSISSKTDILVVIGYSFPFFNRKVDKEIFKALKENNKLKTIYYQDPYKSGEFLRNQFELPDKVLIKNIKEVDNYYIPFEL